MGVSSIYCCKMILTGTPMFLFLTYAVTVSLASYATTPARQKQCRSVYDTVYEPQCTTSYEQDCSTSYGQECSTEYTNQCSTEYKQECTPVTEYSRECSTNYEQ